MDKLHESKPVRNNGRPKRAICKSQSNVSFSFSSFYVTSKRGSPQGVDEQES